MSPIAPAGTPSKKTGRLVAVWTRATSKAEGARVTINHAAPAFCIQVPMFETALAIHNQRNQVYARGDQVLWQEDVA